MPREGSYQLNPRSVTRRIGEALVAGQQRGVQCFRQSYINPIIRCQVIPKRPDAPEQRAVEMTVDEQICVIGKRRFRLFTANTAGH